MKRYNYLSAVLSALILTGCGGGGGSVENGDDEKTANPPHLSQKNIEYSANPLYPQQWALHHDSEFYAKILLQYGIVGDPNANIHPWPETTKYTGKGIKVGIIDDALDTRHEDLIGSIDATYNVATGGKDVSPEGYWENHGTEVTGVAAARSNQLGIAGVAPEASIYFVKLPFSSGTSTSQIVEAFEKIKEWNVDVLNCSWGSGNADPAVKDAIVDLAKNGRKGKGTVIVFAVGNGSGDQTGDPIGNDESAIEEVIAVGATTIQNIRAEYSKYGPALDLMAPGGNEIGITTLDQMGPFGESYGNYLHYNDPYTFAGTSASAPIVTGVVAQLLQANKELTRKEIIQALEKSSDKIGDESYDQDGRNDYYGYGKVNASKALKYVQ